MDHKTAVAALLLAASTVMAAPASAGVDLAQVASGLQSPVAVVNAGDGSGRLFIVEQVGRVRILEGGVLLTTPFLDISSLVTYGGERGLLGLVFHPQYETNGSFFVNYIDTAGDTRVARYQVSSDPDVANPTGTPILFIDQPVATNHKAGDMHFGPDGHLYIAVGDGGTSATAQQMDTLLGKILRIHVTSSGTYTIPADNPFVGVAGARAEIWDLGLRNPWRFSFDRRTGDMFIGDVGQNVIEEIDFAAAGLGGNNWGWRRMEGSQCYDPPTGCNDGSLELPIIEYTHDPHCSVTGGYRYRGVDVPELTGRYVYADYCSGFLWAATRQGDATWTPALLRDTSRNPSAFGEDERGELYLADIGSGTVHRLFSTTPVLSIGDATSTEVDAGTSTATFTVTLQPASGGPVTVSWSTAAAGTATAGGDYVVSSGNLSFAPGQTAQAFTVPVNGDTMDEADETFFVNLTLASGAPVGDGQGRGLIVDDDAAPSLRFGGGPTGNGDRVTTEGTGTTNRAAYSVILSAASGRNVRVTFATGAGGTASTGTDFVAKSGSLLFSPGQTSKTFTIELVPDALDEPNETYFVNLSAPVNATLADGQAQGTIVDDDAAGARALPAGNRHRPGGGRH